MRHWKKWERSSAYPTCSMNCFSNTGARWKSSSASCASNLQHRSHLTLHKFGSMLSTEVFAMRPIVLTLMLAAFLRADNFASVSVASGDCPVQAAQSTTGTVSVEASCYSAVIGGIGSNGSAEAGGSYVNISMHSVDGRLSPIVITADARNTATATLPGDGIGFATLSFDITGLIIKDGAGVSRGFTFSSGSDSEQFTIDTIGCHYCPVDQVVTTQPLQVTFGQPFEYTTELTAGIDLYGGGSAIASAQLGAAFEGGGSGSGGEVPEPSSFVLLGTVLLAGCCYRRFHVRPVR